MGDELTEDLDWLDAKLRDDMPYIDDAGFTAQVVQKLPASRFASRKLRGFILFAAALIASVIAYLFAGPTVVSAAAFLFAVPMTTTLILAGAVILIVMAIGGSLAFSRVRSGR